MGADKIQPITASKQICMMLYGFSGSGKTRLVGGGPRTLIVRPPTDHTDSILAGTTAKEWEVDDWDEMIAVYEHLRHGGSKDFDWVWLDSISLFQDHGLDDIWDGVVAEKPHRAKHGIDKGEYGVNMHRLGMWVRHMVGLKEFNFGVTAHPAELAGELGDGEKLRPYVQGKNMSNKICGYMNLVAYLEVNKDGRRILRSKETDDYYAKDQFDAFLPNCRLVDPTMPKIIEAIKKTRPQATASGRATTTKRRTTRRPTK